MSSHFILTDGAFKLPISGLLKVLVCFYGAARPCVGHGMDSQDRMGHWLSHIVFTCSYFSYTTRKKWLAYSIPAVKHGEWQHHAVGGLISGRDRETGNYWRKGDCGQKKKKKRSLKRTNGSAFNTQPRQGWSGSGTSLWLSLSGPAKVSTLPAEHLWRDDGSSQMLPIKFDGAWEDLPRRMGWSGQIQVWKVCGDLTENTQKL